MAKLITLLELSAEDVLKKNEMARFRYGAMHKRFDKFDFD